MGLREAIKNPSDLRLEEEFDPEEAIAKATYLTFVNPDDPGSEIPENLQSEMQKYFESVKWLLTKTGEDRVKLVGRFVYAVRESIENNNEEPLDELVEDIKE